MKSNFYLRVFSLVLCCVAIVSCNDDKELDKNPVADFTTKIEGFKVEFINLSENGLTYHWNFGDGTESTEKDPEHVYASSGKFNVVLTVDNASGSKELTKEVVIEELFQGDRILIDGKFEDWSLITSFTSGENADYKGLSELKVCSNQKYIYVYGKADKEIFPTSYISILFDYDLSNTTGYKPWYADAGFETMAQISVEFRDGPLFLYTGNPGEANWMWEELVPSGTGFNVWGELKEVDNSIEFEFSLDKTKIQGLGNKTVGVSSYLEKDWLPQGIIPANGTKSLLLNLETGVASTQQ
jgi:PKD repeat protein